MPAGIRKRSLTVAGHRTSVSLEEPLWEALREVARSRRRSLAALVSDIDQTRGEAGLSSAIRTFLLNHYRSHKP